MWYVIAIIVAVLIYFVSLPSGIVVGSDDEDVTFSTDPDDSAYRISEEIERRSRYLELQSWFEEHSKLRKPQVAFQRWIFERHLHMGWPRADPLIPNICNPHSVWLERELLEEGNENAAKIVDELEKRAQSAAVKPYRYVTPAPVYRYHQKDHVVFACNQIKLKVTNECYRKLRRIYSASDFQDDVFVMLLRYNTLFGGSVMQTGLQGAIVPEYWQILQRYLGVTGECFASPMNSTMTQYCSAFPDTDESFGSLGTFFNFYPTTGSFEANPPFQELFMQKMTQHMVKLLQSSSEPLSFCIFVPYWKDAESIEGLISNEYCKAYVVLPANKHEYVTGSQFLSGVKRYVAVHDTLLCVLQNNAGFEKWPPFVCLQKIEECSK